MLESIFQAEPFLRPLETHIMDPHSHDHTPSPVLEYSSRTFNHVITYVQAFTLIAIGIATIVGISSQILIMVDNRMASLGDLLLLFLYIEILSMIKGSALGIREIPIRTPVALAIVAIARFFVVDVEHMTPTFMVLTAASILILVIALWVLSTVKERH